MLLIACHVVEEKVVLFGTTLLSNRPSERVETAAYEPECLDDEALVVRKVEE
jgi:hypothetical protein